MKDLVEIRMVNGPYFRLVPSLQKYKEWTKVSRFLAIGLIGIDIREITDDPLKK